MFRLLLCGCFFFALLLWPFWSPGPWWVTGIGMIVGAILFMILLSVTDMAWDDDIPTWSFGTVIASFVLYVILLGYYEDDYEIESKVELVATQPMHSLRPFTDVSGAFFLGTGTIGSRYGYVTYEQLDDGGFQPVVISGAAILYQDAERPEDAHYETFQVYERRSRSDWSPILRHALGYGEHSEWEPRSQQYKIHVPEGTVIQSFEG